MKSLNIPDIEGFIPFMDKEKLFLNAIKEVSYNIDNVIEHYSFLDEGDYETGRTEQFQPRNLKALCNLQIEITRLSWLRTKYSEWNSDEMVSLWKRHRVEFEICKQLTKEYLSRPHED